MKNWAGNSFVGLFTLIHFAIAYGYPVKLVKVKFPNAAYDKQFFLMGDVHSCQHENSQGGKRLLGITDRFFAAVNRAAHKNREKIPLIWEASSANLKEASSGLYLRAKARELSRTEQKGGSLRLIPADNLREKSPLLKKFMLEMVYHPERAANFLQQGSVRSRLVTEIERVLLPTLGNTLENKLLRIERNHIPQQIFSTLAVNAFWYQEDIFHIKKSLRVPFVRFFQPEDFLNYYKKTFARTTEDLELLLSAFAEKEKVVIVYAGNGHVSRLQKYLKQLGFVSEYEIESRQYLNKEHFQHFWQHFRNRHTDERGAGYQQPGVSPIQIVARTPFAGRG